MGIFYFDSPILSVNGLGLYPRLYVFKKNIWIFLFGGSKESVRREKLAGCLRSVYIDLSKAINWPLPHFLLTYSAMCCKKMQLFCCNLSSVFATFSFLFLSPASLSHFILFICKVSMTVNCLFGGGVEAF